MFGPVAAHRAFIALGASLGDREKNLRDALRALDETQSVKVVTVSSFREYAAVGGPADAPAFLNAVAEVETKLSPEELLTRMLEIERGLGRVRLEKWGPRTIDLDLLLYGQQIISRENLTIPHPRLRERRFVLEPLAEIAPAIVVPGVNLTVSQLLQAL